VLEFRILGPFEVVEEEQALQLGGPRQRALLAVLLLHRGEVLSSDRLIDLIWGERPPATAAKTLQVYVSHLRKAIGDGVLVTRGGGYVLDARPEQVDAERFTDLAADGRSALGRGDAAGARELLVAALGLWRGEALADLAYEPFAAGEVARLEEARLDVLEDRLEADLMLGAHREVVAELGSLVRDHPQRERLLGELMVALYRCGRQAEALEAYRRGRDGLADELGLEPGPQLRALQQRILEHDPELEAPPDGVASPAQRPVRARAGRARLLLAAGGALLLAAAIAAGVVEMAAGRREGLLAAPNSVAAINVRSNRLVAQVPVGARPSPIAYGDGSLWVGNLDDRTVSEVDASTLRTLRTLSVTDPPQGIAVANGSVWVVGSSPSSTYVSAARIDPQFASIDRTVRLGNVEPDTEAAVAAAKSTVVVAPYAGELTTLDARTGAVVHRLDPNAAPTAIAVGAGATWLTQSDADSITRIDPTGLISSVAVGHGPSGIAVGDGGVWVADTGDNAVVRIDPGTHAVTTTIPVGDAPTGVAVGAGSVWVANGGDGTITRIDPHTDRATATIRVGGSPQAVLVAGARVWVTVDAPAVKAAGIAARNDTLRVDAPFDVGYMDPALAYDGVSWELLYATCAKLLNYPDKSGLVGSQLVPEVAQSLPTVSDGGRTYTFTIRPGFRFSPPSNAPVTAETFKNTIERTLNPAMKSPVDAEFDDVVGGRAYMAGRAAHISGVAADGDKLVIRLTAPDPDLLSRLAQPFFCAVPTDTPVNPQGVRLIPSAGPYQVASYTPGQGIVLTRNPNYRGSRPHRLARIEVAVNVPGPRAVSHVLRGSADYAFNGEVVKADAAGLAARYGAGSPAARAGHQQYFVTPEPSVDFYALNTHRPLFADLRMRQAVNYAIDRAALARLGDTLSLLPEPPTDHYLPPDMPGYRDTHVYPLTSDLAKARQLARGHADARAVLLTCNVDPCTQAAQIIKSDLAAIGIHVEVHAVDLSTMFTEEGNPRGRFDMALQVWVADYPDPDAILNLLLETGTYVPTLKDPTVRAQLAAAARLSGPNRYLTYGRLDLQIARNAAPWIAYGSAPRHELFSTRVGCQTYGPYGVDLAALCIRKR
jgi:YVTN family beta-propeller protein